MSRSASSVLGVGLYTVGDAGRLIHASPGAVRSWVDRGLAPSPVNVAFGETTVVSFLDLISLKIVRVLRDQRISLEKIRAAEKYLRTEWGFARPFSTRRILTDGRSVLIALGADPKKLTSADRQGQEVIFAVIRKDLVDVTFGDSGAESWRPANDVVLRPEIQLGAPCVEGTRIPTRTLFGFHRAGDSAAFLAKSYDLPRRKVERAIAYEESLEKAA